MMSLLLNILLIIIGVIGFIIQIPHLFVATDAEKLAIDTVHNLNNKENEPKKRKTTASTILRRIPVKGRWALLLAFLMALLGVLNLFVTDSEKQSTQVNEDKKYNELRNRFDSLGGAFNTKLNTTAAGIAYQFGLAKKDGDTNTVAILTNALLNKNDLLHTIDSMRRKLDSINNASNMPVLYITSGDSINPNPIMKTTGATHTFKLDVVSANQYPAYPISCRFMSVWQSNTGLNFMIETEGNCALKERSYIKDIPQTSNWGFPELQSLLDLLPPKEFYIIFELRYANSLGVMQKPLRGIFLCSAKYIDKEAPHVNNKTYKLIDDFLKESKHWE